MLCSIVVHVFRKKTHLDLCENVFEGSAKFVHPYFAKVNKIVFAEQFETSTI